MGSLGASWLDDRLAEPKLNSPLMPTVTVPGSLPLFRGCQHIFGPPRASSGSRRINATPWLGDLRVPIHNDHISAKAYEVCQVLAAIDRLVRVANDNEGCHQ